MGACLFLSPGYPTEMPFFVRGLAEQGVRVAGIGDQPVGAPAADGVARARPLPPGRNLWDEAATVETVRKWASTIGGIDQRRGALGARDDPRRAPARGPRRPRHDRRADGALPRQGEHEAGARRGRRAHPAPPPRDERGRGARRRRAAGLPADHQAHRGRGLRRHLPPRKPRRARGRAAEGAAREGDERRGVHRGRGVHLRHDLRRRAHPLPQLRVVPAQALGGPQQRVDQPPDDRAQGPHRPAAPARHRARPPRGRGARLHRRGSPTWSGS